MSSIFGGSNEQRSSGNLAYQGLNTALTPQVNNSTSASNGLAALLGIGGDPAKQQQAFSNWRNSTGYQFGLDQGSQAITQNAASRGLLDSGATAKALQTYGTNYANTQYGNYFNQLQGLTNSGNQAAGVLANAGQVSQGTSTSKPGIGAFLGQILSGH
jgi:hypothetical protein